jgi:hypothetical protein
MLERKEVMHMACEKCSFGDPVGEAHYHIVVEKGKVIEVWYLSANGYWDRDLEPDEFFVEYREAPKKFWPFPKWQWPSFRKSTPAAEDWLTPKVYKGKSMHEEEAEDLS